jgi:hypothetical protein
MSSVRIADFRNRADLEKKRKEAAALLEIEIENENRVAAARQRAKTGQPLLVSEVPEKSASEELADAETMRQLAFMNLKSIVKSKDVSPILSKLQTDNEVELFNRFFSQFKQQIVGQKNITPTIFNSLWDRYKTFLTSTGNTGISILPTPGEYDAELKQIQSKLAVLSPETKSNDDAVEMMGYSQEDLDEAFDYAYNINTGSLFEDDIKAKKTLIIEITEPDGKVVEYDVQKDGANPIMLRVRGSKKAYKLANTQKIYYILETVQRTPYTYTINWTGDPNTVIYPGTKKLAKDVIAARTKVSGTGMSTRANYLHRVAPQQQIIGSGLAQNVESDEKRLKIDTIKTTSLPNERILGKHGKNTPNFGNYYVSLKSLKRGFFVLTYPSGTTVSLFPKTLISNTLRRILNDIIFEKSFDEKDYTSLEEDEKKLFDDLLTYTRADNKTILELYRHKKYNDDSRDADVKRFNLLKGQLIAGNTNPELLRELKVLLFRLYDERVIRLKDFQHLLAQLVALT